MKQLALIISLTFTLNCFGQSEFNKSEISKQTGQIVSKIEKVNILKGSAVSYFGIRPEQYDYFIQLRKKATKDELIELTNHSNGVVRCYSFWALSYHSSINLFQLVVNHITDDELVNTEFGCILSREKVGDFFISIVFQKYSDSNATGLSNSQYERLDSILIYSNNTLHAKQAAILRAKQTEALYQRLRYLFLTDNNQYALVALAKFRKEQDVSLILNSTITNKSNDNLFFSYKAISEFPHPIFLPLLEQNLRQTLSDHNYDNEWGELYCAIASYKNDTALTLLKIPFTQVKNQNIREYHIDFVFNALQNFYSPIYDDLLWEMWGTEKKISTNVFRMLFQKNPMRALELTKKTIYNANDFYYLTHERDFNDEELSVNLLRRMLDTVIAKDRSYAIELINKNLTEINVIQFPIFADLALELKDSSFINSLFSRLEKEDNPHVYLKAAQVLISFHDKAINKRIAEAPRKNKNLTQGWGGEEFAKLLKENNIK